MYIKCIKGYYLGIIDYKYKKVDGCIESKSEIECTKCDKFFCINIKSGQCYYNHKIENKEK